MSIGYFVRFRLLAGHLMRVDLFNYTKNSYDATFSNTCNKDTALRDRK